jgi:hypothetical protein
MFIPEKTAAVLEKIVAKIFGKRRYRRTFLQFGQYLLLAAYLFPIGNYFEIAVYVITPVRPVEWAPEKRDMSFWIGIFYERAVKTVFRMGVSLTENEAAVVVQEIERVGRPFFELAERQQKITYGVIKLVIHRGRG